MPRNINAEDLGDHVHPVAIEENGICPIVEFDFGAIDGGEETKGLVPISEAAGAVAQILGWIVGDRNAKDDLKAAGGRAAALQCLLDPTRRYKNLASIARDCGVSRSIVSQWLMALRDNYSLKMNLRGSYVRQHCREAQLQAVQDGTHSSNFTKKNHNEGAEMKRAEIAQKFRTLDAAIGEIERLHNPTSSVSLSFKPAAKPPTLQELSDPELKAALDIANHNGDSAMVAMLYGELNRRRNA
jgi:hypothetical protein